MGARLRRKDLQGQGYACEMCLDNRKRSAEMCETTWGSFIFEITELKKSPLELRHLADETENTCSSRGPGELRTWKLRHSQFLIDASG
jgi:hypothetical protein